MRGCWYLTLSAEDDAGVSEDVLGEQAADTHRQVDVQTFILKIHTVKSLVLSVRHNRPLHSGFYISVWSDEIRNPVLLFYFYIYGGVASSTEPTCYSSPEGTNQTLGPERAFHDFKRPMPRCVQSVTSCTLTTRRTHLLHSVKLKRVFELIIVIANS